MNIQAPANVESVKLVGRIIRADGTVVELGEIATWHRNPIINAWRRFKHFLRR